MERKLAQVWKSHSLRQGYILRFFWIVLLLTTIGCEVDRKRKEKELLDEISGVLDKTKELGDSMDKLKMKDLDYKYAPTDSLGYDNVLKPIHSVHK